MANAFDRIGLVVHPSRSVTRAAATLERWATAAGVEIVQLPGGASGDGASPAAACDLVVALGGDGTTLAALHAAAPSGTPVMGVACGSLGAPHGRRGRPAGRGPGSRGGGRGQPSRAAGAAGHGPGRRAAAGVQRPRAGAARGRAGDRPRRGARGARRPLRRGRRRHRHAVGVLGYTLAVGGPILHPDTQEIVTTPLAPHGGSCPPVLTPAGGDLRITLEPGYGGARVEVDGQPRGTVEPPTAEVFVVGHVPAAGQLVVLDGAESFWAALRRRRIIIDSPRLLARDDREAAAADPAATP
jgi:NAD+ kinase